LCENFKIIPTSLAQNTTNNPDFAAKMIKEIPCEHHQLSKNETPQDATSNASQTAAALWLSDEGFFLLYLIFFPQKSQVKMARLL
jgi:hypothetical protein